MEPSADHLEAAQVVDDRSLPEVSLFSGEFCDPEMERSFQLENWDSRIFQLRIVGIPAAIFFVVGSFVDYLVIGPGPVLTGIVAVRMVVAVAILAMVYFADRLRDRYRLLDVFVSGPVLLISLVTCAVVAAIGGELLMHSLTALVLILLYYLFVPVRLAYALTLSLVFSLLFTIAAVVCLEPSVDQLIQVVLYLTLVNVLGSLVSRERHAIRRRGFALIQIERSAVEELRREIASRAAAEEALIESEGRFRSLVELSPDAILVHRDGELLYINLSGITLMGGDTDSRIPGKTVYDFLLPKFRDSALERADTLLSTGGPVPAVEIVLRTLDDREIACEIRSSAIVYKHQPAIQSVVRDITEQKQLQEELTRLATTDPLTAVCNRRMFFERLEKEWSRARRHSRRLSILLLDLDFFKQINDNFGHAVGDVMLQTVAASTQELLRSEDLLARLGGEEFGILLPEVDLEGATALAERIREHIAQAEVSTPDGAARCTVSIGVAECRPVKESPEGSLKRADDSLYAAKDAGRNRVCVGQPPGAQENPG